MKQTLLSISFLLCTLLFHSTINAQFPQAEKIDELFAEWDNSESPGAALGIIKNGKFIYRSGYGMANLEYGIPNSSKSVFRIASTSKQFTAASIILLAQQKKLNLSDPLTKFFPDFPDYAKSITVQHLLNHTSGIRDYLSLSYLAGLTDNDYYTDKEVMKWLVNQKTINFKPGEKFLYSNSGYWLLGKIVDKVYGKSMATFAKKEIFEPLKMNHTHFHNNHKMIVKNRASGYQPVKDGFEISMTTLDMIGDGGIFTTVDDMKKWDDAYYHSDILNQDFWRLMTTVGTLNNGTEINYAAGLGVRDYKGLKMISHGGAFVGYRAEFIRFPEKKLSIILFANRSDARPTAKAEQIANILLENDFSNANSAKKSKTQDSKPVVKLKDVELKKWLGDYWYEEGAYARRIILKNNALYYYRSESSESKLSPVGKNQFIMDEDPRVLISFSIKKDKRKELAFSFNGEKPDIAMSFDALEYSTEQLKAFEGKYYSDELDSTYQLKLDKKNLTLFINGKESSTFNSVKKNLLVNERYGAFQFKRNKQGKVKSFVLSAGRVQNLEFTRI